MSGLFGGGGSSQGPTRLSNLAVQTSALGLAITKGWGRGRIKANLLWFNDFNSVTHSEKQGGKGGGAKVTSYNYFASVILGLGEGLMSVRTVYRDKEVLTPVQAGLGVMSGAVGQAPWSYVTSTHPTEALGYSGIAYAYASGYPLSDSATLPNHSFEVDFEIQQAGKADANPKDILNDLFYNTNSGIPNWDAGLLSTAHINDYGNYCLATGLLLSPVLESQVKASEFIEKQLMDATNSNIFWSEGRLKIKPLGDEAITGNGVTWTPDLTPVYDLNEDDFLKGSSVVQEIVDQSDAYNNVQVEYLDRSNQYNTAIAPAQDLSNIIEYGRRKEDPQAMHSICDAAVAQVVAQLRLQRKLYIRETYQFKVDDRYSLLELGDYVTLTTTTDRLLLDRLLVRIIDIDEENDVFTITCEATTTASASAAIYNTHPSTGYIANTGAEPGSVTSPSLINPPTALTNGASELWVFAASSSALWGGCEVWSSLDGSDYKYEGRVKEPGRYGFLTTTLAATNDPDPSGTFTVDLSVSRGVFSSVSVAERDAGATLCMIDQEVISFKNAVLVSGNTYTVSDLRRGLYGTKQAAHGIGAKLTRLDDLSVFRIPYPRLGTGQTAHFKFLSFNLWNLNLENLADVTDYTVGAIPVITPASGVSKSLVDSFNYMTPGDFIANWSSPRIPGAAGFHEVALVAAPDKGGVSIKLGNNSYPDATNAFFFDDLVYDPEDLYRISFDIEFVSATGSVVIYAGLAALDANDNNLSGDTGTYCYTAVSGLAHDGQRHTFTGYFRGLADSGVGNQVGFPGRAQDNPCPMPTGTVRVVPMFLANYTTTGGAGETIFHGMSCDKVDDATVFATGEWDYSRSYYIGEGVNFNGRYFGSRVQPNLNHTPPNAAASDAYWFFISDRGRDGDFILAATDANVLIDGHRAIKVSGGADWNAGFRTVVGYLDGASFTVKTPGGGKAQFIGFSNNPSASSSYGDLNVSLYFTGANETQLWSGGLYVSTLSSNYLTTSSWTVKLENNLVTIWADTTIVYSPTAFSTVGTVWYIDGTLYNPAAEFEVLAFSNISRAGTDGAPGSSFAELTVFKQAASAPSTPTGGSYNFTTKIVTPPSGWVTDPSSFSGTDPVWAVKITASVLGSTGTVSLGTWTSPGKVFASGVDGTALDIIYIRSTTLPTTPSPSSGVPTGWYADPLTVPAGSGLIWQSVGERPSLGANYTWQTAVRSEGQTGAAGVSTKTLTSAYDTVTLMADYGGAIKAGQLGSRANKCTYKDGDTDVSSTTTWSRVDSDVTTTISSTGNVVITAFAADGFTTVTGVYGGVTLTKLIRWNKQDDPAPPQSVSTDFIGGSATISSISYAGTTGGGTASANGSGVLRTTVYVEIVPNGGTGGCRMAGYVAYRVAGSGGSWTAFSGSQTFTFGSNISGENVATNARYIDTGGGFEEPFSGFLSFVQTTSGLTANGTYEIAFFYKKYSGTSTGTAYPGITTEPA